MPRSGPHGTNCCGAASMQGFGTAEENNLNSINDTLRGIAQGRLVDITLNANQVARPGTMQRLADLGFVLDAHWINSVHGSHVYRFTRCDTRRALLDGPIAGRWNGMVMTAGLHGDLPAVPGQAAPGRGGFDYAPYIRPLPAWAREEATRRGRLMRDQNARAGNIVGARFRINSPRSRYHNQELVCTAIEQPWDRDRVLVFENGARISINSCVRIGNAPAGAGYANRLFNVGDRIQIARTWGADSPVGLCGTVVRTVGYQVVIQWDDPRAGGPFQSNPEYIHLVDFDRQPDFPRERIVVAPRPEAPIAPQRHENAEVPLRAAERPAPVAPPAPAPEVRRVVGAYWHCVFRDGRRGAGYQSFAEATRNLGRRTRIDRFEIMSDGTTRWADNARN